MYDLLLSKRGIATPSNHPIRLAVERHKTRLNAEFTKLRVRHRCASIQDFRLLVAKESQNPTFAPRWVRINNATTTMDHELKTTFASFKQVTSLSNLASATTKAYYLDTHIPDLLAVGPDADLVSSAAYKDGRIILQDKASCFPAYLLLGNQIDSWTGDIIDGCAAPGNKTTHLASLLCSEQAKGSNCKKSRIYSLDASQPRSKVLQRMVKVAGVENRVTVVVGQDFLALAPDDPRFENVRALLLDPSCSGSGILKREDIPELVLPDAKSGPKNIAQSKNTKGNRRKRKRDGDSSTLSDISDPMAVPEEEGGKQVDSTRLTKLSNLQSQIIEHAFKFPAAIRVTYSTCSIHSEENENVVARVLASPVAKQRGWTILPRSEQPEGLQTWGYRGISRDPANGNLAPNLTAEEAESCIRCWPGDEQGSGGFFVAGFVRNPDNASDPQHLLSPPAECGSDYDEDDAESWSGCSSL